MKRCPTCLRDLPLEAFSTHRSYCPECYRAYKRARHRRLADAGWRRGKTPAGRYREIKASTEQRGISFALTREEVIVFWEQPCHYCGGAFSGLGLDRVDNDRGYEPGNVVPCCGLCNTWKVDMSEAGFKGHLTRVYQHFVLGHRQLPLPVETWQMRHSNGRPRLA